MRYLKPKKSKILTDRLTPLEMDALKALAVKSQLMGTHITPMHPHFGFYVRVGDIELPERLFPKEYAQINEIYHEVLERLDLYFKETVK
jgi:3-polyprenyl-4-hydroxybenzoate decarboxylase